MTILEWTGWIGAAFAWLTAGFFLWRAFVSKSRQRYCPKCDYIIHESGNLRCPECGKVARNEQQFYTGRHRRRRVMIALSFMMLGVILQAAPRVKQNGLIQSMPTTGLILWADWGSSEEAFMEIRKRAFDDVVPIGVNPWRWQSDVLYGWQKKLLTRSCMHALEPHRPQSLRLASFDLLMHRLTAANGDYTQLVSCLTDSDPMIQENVSYALPEIHIFIDETVKARIRDQLIDIIKLSRDPLALYYAALFLGDNEAIRQEVSEWLNDDDPMFRMLACHVLEYEDESGSYIPVLIDLVMNVPKSIWPITGFTFDREGWMMLTYSHLDSPGALAELMKAIEHPDEYIQGWAIRKIGKMGENALPALELLIVKLNHPNRSIQVNTISSIGAIGKEAHAAVSDLLRFVDGEMYGLSGVALKAAIQIDPDPDRFTPLVIDMLAEAVSYNRANLYRAMRWLDLTDERVLSSLRKGLKDSETEPRTAAAESLGFIKPTSLEIISTLIAALDDPEEDVRLASVTALVKHPEYANEFEPHIRTLLANDDEEDVRVAAAQVLGLLSGDQKTIDTLVLALEDRNSQVQYHTIKALGHIGPKAASAIPALRGLINENGTYGWMIDEANAALELIERRESSEPDA